MNLQRINLLSQKTSFYLIRTIPKGQSSHLFLTTAGAFGDDGILDGDPAAILLQLFFRSLRQILLPVLRSAPSSRTAVKAQKGEMTLFGGFARHARGKAAGSLLRT